MKALVTGAGGFIGIHLVRALKREGFEVRGADLKLPQWSETAADEFHETDLRDGYNARAVVWGMDWIFDLAADMGGIGYLSVHDAEMAKNNALINLNVIRAATEYGNARRYFFPSSACVYPVRLQQFPGAAPLKESSVMPADPDGGYGWQKLFHEVVCKHFRFNFGFETRVARLHNCYGQATEWRSGREKAPAALCRKIAVAKLTGNPEVEIWGYGDQERSFMHVDDCVDGILRLMQSDFPGPLNIGRDRSVTINELADMIADIAGIEIVKKYVKGATGVSSRNSDNSLCREKLGWSPGIPLEEGLKSLYRWVEGKVLETWKE